MNKQMACGKIVSVINMFFRSRQKTFEYLIVGLGNPGMQYENTRHNAGFLCIDALCRKFNLSLSRRKFDAVFGDAQISGKRVIVAKPQTFMNNSGRAVAGLSRYYKIPAERIIVVFDDISLPVGNIRIRRKGSAGGHNGIKDIIELLGTESIMRIKIGIGGKPNSDYDLKDWVLGKMPKEQEKEFHLAFDTGAEAIVEIIEKGIDSAMNKYSK